MPQHLVRVNLDQLAPFFARHLLEVLAECEARGAAYYAYSGHRSHSDQRKLYEQGRTRLWGPGGVQLKKVTDAQPGFSLHNYGLAVDCALDVDLKKPGLQPDWKNDKGQYNLLKQVGEKWGFQVGVPSIPGGDPGHLQIPLKKLYNATEAKVLGHWRKIVRDLGEEKGIRDIWREIEMLWPVDTRKTSKKP